MTFKDWLAKINIDGNGKPKVDPDKYVAYVNKWNEYGKNNKIRYIKENFDLMDLDNLLDAITNIEQQDEFIKQNKASNRAYSNALKCYLKYRVFLQSKSSDELEKYTFKSNVPKEIFDYYDKPFEYECEKNIFYADDVTDDEKIPGLIEYLYEEYGMIFELCFGLKHIGCDLTGLGLGRYYIPVILSKELPVNIYKNSKEQTAKILESLKDDPKYDYDMILKILNFKKDDRILGTYYHSGGPEILNDNCRQFIFEDGSLPYIKIYYKNIDCSDEKLYKAKLANTLAHELFHFEHDIMSPIFNNDHDMFERKVVVESLAEYASSFYSINQGFFLKNHYYKHDNNLDLYKYYFDVVKNKYDSWVYYDGTCWPYAYACYLFFDEYYYFRLIDPDDPNFEGYNDYDKNYYNSMMEFLRILNESICNMEEAYFKIMNL